MFPVARGRGWAQLTEQGIPSTPEGLSKGTHSGHSLLLQHFRGLGQNPWLQPWTDWEELCQDVGTGSTNSKGFVSAGFSLNCSDREQPARMESSQQ